MSPPLIGVEEGQSTVSVVAAATSVDGVSHEISGLKERNYLGLSDCSSVDSSAVSNLSDESKSNLNLKATELRLGLPGSQSPGREPDVCLLNAGKLNEQKLFPLLPSKDGICSSTQKGVASGNKRVFSDAIDGFSEVKTSKYAEGNWMFHGGGSDSKPPQGSQGINMMLSPRPSGPQPAVIKEAPLKSTSERTHTLNGTGAGQSRTANNPPAAKAQVVGWPPIRSFRKNSLASASKENDEVDGKPGPGALFVKVSMDGAPYLRKVDLRNYSTYQELSSALEKMFSGFTIGQYGSSGTSGRETLTESKLKDLLHGSEYVLTYEDKDGDWMLVGDVPWEMFTDLCKRLKIMKGSDAIGLAPRAVEKSKTRN